MTYSELDALFPYIVFAYGILVSTVTRLPALLNAGRGRFSDDTLQRLIAHRPLAMICLWVGAFWILQNIWLG